jgi:23S rRNA (guanosine2251-2'-O)-methyltransferase
MKKLSMDELNRLSVEAFKQIKKTSIIIVLDNVRSLHNVGSFFRTADAFQIEKIYLCGITGTPPNREIHKTALGATESIEWEYAASALDFLPRLKDEGYEILSIEQTDQSISLEKFTVKKEGKFVLIFGNEVYGVSEAVIKISDHAIEVPQFGTKHSFNVSVTGGILLWEFFRRIHLD